MDARMSSKVLKPKDGILRSSQPGSLPKVIISASRVEIYSSAPEDGLALG